MTADPDDWHQVLARVTGALVRGEQRVTTHELLKVHLGIPVTDRASRRLKRVMRDLGWRGPKPMRWGEKTLHGYWRYPTLGDPHEEPAHARLAPARADRDLVVEGNVLEEGVPGELANALEYATRLGLQKICQILQLPTDRSDGNILRAQTSAAGIAINAQLRADEARLRAKKEGDVLDRLLKAIEAEKKRQAQEERKRDGAPVVEAGE